MASSAPKRPPVLLLLEPFSVLRQTVAMVARDLGIAEVVQAASLESAVQLMETRRFDACIVGVAEDRREMALIQRLRAGTLQAPASTPVAVTTAGCDAGMILALKDLQVSRIVLKPFKVKTILETLNKMAEVRTADSALAA